MKTRRLSKLPENQLQTRLEALRADISSLKGAPQFTGGASIVFFTSKTASTWDWTGTLPDPGSTGYGGKLFLVTATAQNMTAFWGNCGDTLCVDTSTSPYGGLQYMTDYKNANSPIGITYTDVPSSAANANVKQWYVQVAGKSTRTIWIKFFVIGLDTATVTVTALN